MATIFSFLTRTLGLVGLVAVSAAVACAAYAAAIWAIEPAGGFSLWPGDSDTVVKAVGAGLLAGIAAFLRLLHDDGLPRETDFEGSGLASALGDLADTFDD